MPPRVPPSSWVSPGPLFWELPCLTAALHPLWSEEPLGSRRLGSRTREPGGTRWGRQGHPGALGGLCGEGARRGHTAEMRVEAGSVEGRRAVPRIFWKLHPQGMGWPAGTLPQWLSGCRGVLTGTHACFMDAEKRPRGPHPEGSREPTASASADPALVGCVKVLQPGSGVLVCVSITRETPRVTPASSTHAHARHMPGSHTFPCRALLRSHTHRTRFLPQETQAPLTPTCPTSGQHTSILPSAIWDPGFPTVSPRRRSFVGSLRQRGARAGRVGGTPAEDAWG